MVGEGAVSARWYDDTGLFIDHDTGDCDGRTMAQHSSKANRVFTTEHSEASARRTKFVQRASKMTGKSFLALVTFGRWSVPKTSLAQLAAKAAQLAEPVAVTPEAVQQRMNDRAVAFLQDLLQTAFAKLHTADTGCDQALFTPFGRVHIADSTGFGLPDSLQAQFPGAGGSGSKAGAKIQLVWDYKSHPFDHFALIPWNIPDNTYVETVVELARPYSLLVFDLGDFKLAAFAQIAAAQAYQPLDLPRSLAHDSRALLEKPVVLGTHDPVAARLIAVRMPEAIVNERRRQARAVAKKRGYTPSQAHLSLLAWNLFITNVPTTVWSAQTACMAYSLRWQVALVFKSWKSHLHLATLTTTTKYSTLCDLYGRMLLILLTYAFCPTLHATVWQKHQRELSLLKLVRHFQVGADQWFRMLFQSAHQLAAFLSQVCTAAERLVMKAVRKRRTSAQRLRDSLGPQLDFFEPALALAA
jgi:hypothetical protein